MNTAEPRVLIVSNRLPVTLRQHQNEIRVQPSSGGLASGLRGFSRSGAEMLWIGWPGNVSSIDPSQTERLRESLMQQRAFPVFLTPEEIRSFYEGFCNEVLWPLFHFNPERLPLDSSADWEPYKAVNEKFADCVAELYREGDQIWVHDYHLTLLPEALRRRLPKASIGYFLHIPFPPSELFRILPWREQILRGILGADLIGFHTYSYLRHFTFSLIRILGLEVNVDRIDYEGRQIHLGAYPLGVDAEVFAGLADSTRVVRELEHIRTENAGRRLLLGIDRLDYIKGIPRRLLAVEKLLERYPELRWQVRLVQVIVPSRTGVESYARYRRQIDETVGRINGAYATVNTVPIHHLHRSIPDWQMVALYRAADVMLVTSTRDGMNLVAKEFIASRTDEDGVLVLSEFAGASVELGEALQVNPYDPSATCDAIHMALEMPREERRTRMRSLRKRVLSFTSAQWARAFLTDLGMAHEENKLRPGAPEIPEEVDTPLEYARKAERLILLLDYDGTLVPFTNVPALAVPDSPLLDLLAAVANRPNTSVHLVSGRTKESLETWFGTLPIGLHAEHGFWSRKSPEAEWVAWGGSASPWKEKLIPVLESFTENTPGSLIEVKTASVSWHYRMADPEFGPIQAKELRVYVTEMFSNVPVEVTMGEKVVEIRAAGLNKGVILPQVLGGTQPPYLVVAIGDDRTDEDLFSSLPPGGIAIVVGNTRSTSAQFRLRNFHATRSFLQALV